MASVNDLIRKIESRFKEVADLEGDLEQYPLADDNHLQVKTNKEKSDKFGEVFTPLWLVDKMEDLVNVTENSNTLDLCSGYGQFSVRLLRKMYSKYGENFNIRKFLYNRVKEGVSTHTFSEIQLESCFKLLYIFGNKISLYIGDSRKLSEMSDDVGDGILYYHEVIKKWINITDFIKDLNTSVYNKENETGFVQSIESMIESIGDNSKDLEMF